MATALTRGLYIGAGGDIRIGMTPSKFVPAKVYVAWGCMIPEATAQARANGAREDFNLEDFEEEVGCDHGSALDLMSQWHEPLSDASEPSVRRIVLQLDPAALPPLTQFPMSMLIQDETPYGVDFRVEVTATACFYRTSRDGERQEALLFLSWTDASPAYWVNDSQTPPLQYLEDIKEDESD